MADLKTIVDKNLSVFKQGVALYVRLCNRLGTTPLSNATKISEAQLNELRNYPVTKSAIPSQLAAYLVSGNDVQRQRLIESCQIVGATTATQARLQQQLNITYLDPATLPAAMADIPNVASQPDASLADIQQAQVQLLDILQRLDFPTFNQSKLAPSALHNAYIQFTQLENAKVAASAKAHIQIQSGNFSQALATYAAATSKTDRPKFATSNAEVVARGANQLLAMQAGKHQMAGIVQAHGTEVFHATRQNEPNLAPDQRKKSIHARAQLGDVDKDDYDTLQRISRERNEQYQRELKQVTDRATQAQANFQTAERNRQRYEAELQRVTQERDALLVQQQNHPSALEAAQLRATIQAADQQIAQMQQQIQDQTQAHLQLIDTNRTMNQSYDRQVDQMVINHRTEIQDLRDQQARQLQAKDEEYGTLSTKAQGYKNELFKYAAQNDELKQLYAEAQQALKQGQDEQLQRALIAISNLQDLHKNLSKRIRRNDGDDEDGGAAPPGLATLDQNTLTDPDAFTRYISAIQQARDEAQKSPEKSGRRMIARLKADVELRDREIVKAQQREGEMQAELKRHAEALNRYEVEYRKQQEELAKNYSAIDKLQTSRKTLEAELAQKRAEAQGYKEVSENDKLAKQQLEENLQDRLHEVAKLHDKLTSLMQVKQQADAKVAAQQEEIAILERDKAGAADQIAKNNDEYEEYYNQAEAFKEMSKATHEQALAVLLRNSGGDRLGNLSSLNINQKIVLADYLLSAKADIRKLSDLHVKAVDVVKMAERDKSLLNDSGLEGGLQNSFFDRLRDDKRGVHREFIASVNNVTPEDKEVIRPIAKLYNVEFGKNERLQDDEVDSLLTDTGLGRYRQGTQYNIDSAVADREALINHARQKILENMHRKVASTPQQLGRGMLNHETIMDLSSIADHGEDEDTMARIINSPSKPEALKRIAYKAAQHAQEAMQAQNILEANQVKIRELTHQVQRLEDEGAQSNEQLQAVQELLQQVAAERDKLVAMGMELGTFDKNVGVLPPADLTKLDQTVAEVSSRFGTTAQSMSGLIDETRQVQVMNNVILDALHKYFLHGQQTYQNYWDDPKRQAEEQLVDDSAHPQPVDGNGNQTEQWGNEAEIEAGDNDTAVQDDEAEEDARAASPVADPGQQQYANSPGSNGGGSEFSFSNDTQFFPPSSTESAVTAPDAQYFHVNPRTPQKPAGPPPERPTPGTTARAKVRTQNSVLEDSANDTRASNGPPKLSQTQDNDAAAAGWMEVDPVAQAQNDMSRALAAKQAGTKPPAVDTLLPSRADMRLNRMALAGTRDRAGVKTPSQLKQKAKIQESQVVMSPEGLPTTATPQKTLAPIRGTPPKGGGNPQSGIRYEPHAGVVLTANAAKQMMQNAHPKAQAQQVQNGAPTTPPATQEEIELERIRHDTRQKTREQIAAIALNSSLVTSRLLGSTWAAGPAEDESKRDLTEAKSLAKNMSQLRRLSVEDSLLGRTMNRSERQAYTAEDLTPSDKENLINQTYMVADPKIAKTDLISIRHNLLGQRMADMQKAGRSQQEIDAVLTPETTAENSVTIPAANTAFKAPSMLKANQAQVLGLTMNPQTTALLKAHQSPMAKITGLKPTNLSAFTARAPLTLYKANESSLETSTMRNDISKLDPSVIEAAAHPAAMDDNYKKYIVGQDFLDNFRMLKNPVHKNLLQNVTAEARFLALAGHAQRGPEKLKKFSEKSTNTLEAMRMLVGMRDTLAASVAGAQERNLTVSRSAYAEIARVQSFIDAIKVALNDTQTRAAYEKVFPGVVDSLLAHESHATARHHVGTALDAALA